MVLASEDAPYLCGGLRKNTERAKAMKQKTPTAKILTLQARRGFTPCQQSVLVTHICDLYYVSSAALYPKSAWIEVKR